MHHLHTLRFPKGGGEWRRAPNGEGEAIRDEASALTPDVSGTCRICVLPWSCMKYVMPLFAGMRIASKDKVE